MPLVAVGMPSARAIAVPMNAAYDAHKDRHEHPDGLLTRKRKATEYADHDPDEDCGDDAGDGHFSSRGGWLELTYPCGGANKRSRQTRR